MGKGNPHFFGNCLGWTTGTIFGRERESIPIPVISRGNFPDDCPCIFDGSTNRCDTGTTSGNKHIVPICQFRFRFRCKSLRLKRVNRLRCTPKFTIRTWYRANWSGLIEVTCPGGYFFVLWFSIVSPPLFFLYLQPRDFKPIASRGRNMYLSGVQKPLPILTSSKSVPKKGFQW